MLVAHPNNRPYGISVVMKGKPKRRVKWFISKCIRYTWVNNNYNSIVEITYYPEGLTITAEMVKQWRLKNNV